MFGPACYHHGMLESPRYWNDVTVNGNDVTAQKQLLAWLNNSTKLEGISTCNGVNCEQSCPHVDVSEEATGCIGKHLQNGIGNVL